MNRITKAEREKIQRYADDIVELDEKQQVKNGRAATLDLIDTFAISYERARGYVSKAARKKRHPRNRK